MKTFQEITEKHLEYFLKDAAKAIPDGAPGFIWSYGKKLKSLARNFYGDRAKQAAMIWSGATQKMTYPSCRLEALIKEADTVDFSANDIVQAALETIDYYSHKKANSVRDLWALVQRRLAQGRFEADCTHFEVAPELRRTFRSDTEEVVTEIVVEVNVRPFDSIVFVDGIPQSDHTRRVAGERRPHRQLRSPGRTG